MKKRIGKYIIKKIGEEQYKAYIPPLLSSRLVLNMDALYPLLEKATRAMAELDAVAGIIPNHALFIYMYVRKEALLSSQIEGTQSSFADLILFENKQKTDIPIADVEEVSYYVKAMYYGLDRLKNGFPLSLRLLRELHEILLSGARGIGKTPGQFRKSQNWIGGAFPWTARFVPPPVEEMHDCLFDLEAFLHDDSLPVLIKTGIAHVQFETIHPFLDGNGRLGRLLITLLLCEEKMLKQPVLYLSLYLKENRHFYYQLLDQVRTQGDWDSWLIFFLKGVIESAQRALQSVLDIQTIFDEDQKKIEVMVRSEHAIFKIFEYIKKVPQISVDVIVGQLEVSAPTARNAIEILEKIGILQEITGKQRFKIYVYKKYLDILESGAQPIKK